MKVTVNQLYLYNSYTEFLKRNEINPVFYKHIVLKGTDFDSHEINNISDREFIKIVSKIYEQKILLYLTAIIENYGKLNSDFRLQLPDSYNRFYIDMPYKNIEVLIGWSINKNFHCTHDSSNTITLYFDFHLLSAYQFLYFPFAHFFSRNTITDYLDDNELLLDHEIICNVTDEKIRTIQYINCDLDDLVLSAGSKEIHDSGIISSDAAFVFVILHELGHIYLSKINEVDIETACDRFASYMFLLCSPIENLEIADLIVGSALVYFCSYVHECINCNEKKNIKYELSQKRFLDNAFAIHKFTKVDDLRFAVLVWNYFLFKYRSTLMVVTDFQYSDLTYPSVNDINFNQY